METLSVPVRSPSSPWAKPNLKSANLASVNAEKIASLNAAESISSENKSEISDETYVSDFPPLPLTARRIGIARGVSSDDELLKKVPSVNHLTFNQDNACFVIGSDLGFIVYNCDPFSERMRRIFDKGSGIGIVEMLHQSNLFALVGVGGADDPMYPSSKVLMWSDQLNRCTGELSCRSVVRSVRLRRDRIIIVLEQKIMLYNYDDFKLLRQIETVPNPKGLCAVSQTSGSFVLICPWLLKGQVKVERYESSGSRKEKVVVAHSSSIECFALSQDGQMFATASSKGTLIRVFNVVDGNLVKEVRRGADRADIYSLAFSPWAEWLAVSSDKGTVHVFNLRVNYGTPEDTPNNIAGGILSSTSLSYIKGVLPKYFSSEWSLAQFRLPEDRKYIVSFGHKKNTVQIVGVDGSFYRCEFDPVLGGEMTQLEYYNFLTPKETF